MCHLAGSPPALLFFLTFFFFPLFLFPLSFSLVAPCFPCFLFFTLALLFSIVIFPFFFSGCPPYAPCAIAQAAQRPDAGATAVIMDGAIMSVAYHAVALATPPSFPFLLLGVS